MADINLSLVLHKKLDLRLEDRTIPEPAPGEVQLRMEAVGICGSDIHFWTEGSVGGEFEVLSAMVMGHESSGTVSKLGPGVTHLKVGDRVAIEPGWPCYKCNLCKCGRYNLCPDVKSLSAYPIDGSLARYHVHPADFCFRLPDHVTHEEGALMEPLSVAIHACRRAKITLGQKVLVLGAGPIGLLTMITAKAMGAAEICITDINEQRLEVAKRLGATYTVHIESRDARSMAEKITNTMGVMPDVTMECSGAEASVQTGIFATKSGGTLLLVGAGPAQKTLPIVNAATREVDIIGTFRYANTYPTAIAMVASGAVNVKPLVTHHFKLEQSLDAFEVAKTGSGGAIKVMIHCDRNWKP